MKSNTNLKKMTSIFSIILIGAIGSGFWDLFLKDVLFYLIDKLFILFNSINSSFLDDIYSTVGHDGSMFEMLPSTIMLLFIIGSIVYMLLRVTDSEAGNNPESPNRFEKIVKSIFDNKKLKVIVVYLPLALTMALYIQLTVGLTSSFIASTHISRSIEILRPYINSTEYYKLRSTYRLTNNKVKLESILERINMISDKYSITLPEVKLIGISPAKKHITSPSN